MKKYFLTTADVIDIHADLINSYGGMRGLRDSDLLLSAIARPQSGYYKNTIQEAAALWESLVINHPFFDGNKRVGLAATHAFLIVNGYDITQDSYSLYNWIANSLQTGTFKFDPIDAFLRKNTTKL